MPSVLESAQPGRGESVSLRPGGSLAKKYTVFTTLLISYVVILFLAYNLRDGHVDWFQLGLLVAGLALGAYAVSKFTNSVLGAPLNRLREGVEAVQAGRLEPMQISRTGDEVEYLGESLNAMIDALRTSRSEIQENQNLLERRIEQRTRDLKVATESALAASRAKSEFLANVSHELRTPMSGVLGMIDIVLDGELVPEQRDQLEAAKGCANMLLALLNDILDLSKIEAGKMLLEHISFDLPSLVRECGLAAAARCRPKGVELRMDLPPEVPTQMIGDPLRIRQILSNLLSNAVKFTDRGWVELKVAASRSSDGAGYDVHFEVSDTGLGIAPQKLSEIFEEFTQADGSISRKYGGTGLGLAITRRLARLHGGTVTVKSEEGRGSSFRATISCGQAQPMVEPALDSDSSAAQQPLGLCACPRILLAEDNQINQRVVTTLLRRNGFEVIVASNGLQALEKLEQTSFGLILMDIQMPGMDGIQTAQRIRAREEWKTLPIVAMTAHAMTGDREKCLAAGMDDYISKPVSPPHLVELVKRYLYGSRPRLKVKNPPDVQGPGGSVKDLFNRHAPEQVKKMQVAAQRMDLPALRLLTRRLEVGAERAGAVSVAQDARQLLDAAAGKDYSLIQQRLLQVERAIVALDSAALEDSLARAASA